MRRLKEEISEGMSSANQKNIGIELIQETNIPEIISKTSTTVYIHLN